MPRRRNLRLEPEKTLSPEEIVRRELEERAWAGFRDLQGRLAEMAEAWLEHREAPYLWRRLERHTAEARLAMVRKSRDFWSPGLCVLVCEKSVAAAVHDGRKAEDLAHLAIEIARQVPGREARRARLEGFAQAVLGNALRVRSQLPLAGRGLRSLCHTLEPGCRHLPRASGSFPASRSGSVASPVAEKTASSL